MVAGRVGLASMAPRQDGSEFTRYFRDARDAIGRWF